MATVLAGPILRKVTPASVTVWLAFKEATTVTLTVWATDKPAAGTTPLMTGVAPATKIGPNLYIVAVTAVPTSANLAYGTIYFYKLTFATKSADALDLVAATKTTDMTAWAYMPYQLPSFLLPPTDLQQVRLSVGSCRKMHTQSLDALALLDDVITGASNDPVQRPQLLMMGGDQIYADDVTATLLVMLTDAGVALIGSEEVPIDSSSSLAPESAPPMTRSSRIKKAGFTSDDTKNHLMGLGEYLAMYLFAWSDAVWPKPTDVPTVDNVTAMPNVNDHFGDENVFDAIKELETMAVERTQIIAVLSTLPKVRRALANIATYMILDDHEITDDFNMQRKFCDAVYASALGMRVVQNGLTAYALCQHWGNCPEQFTGTGAGATLLSMFTAASSYSDLARDPRALTIVGLHAPDKLAQQSPYGVYHDAQSLTYNYTIEGSAFQLIVTDTRTWRTFPRTKSNLTPPDLLPATQVTAQITQTPALGNRLLIALVTTNLPNCPSIRQAARDVPGLPGHKWDSEDFFDSWQIEQIDSARLIVGLSQKAATSTDPKLAHSVVLLSGDVHTSQATRMLYWGTQQVGDAANAATAPLTVFGQLIASALHNDSDDTTGEHYAGYDYVPSRFAAVLFGQPIDRIEVFVGWNPNTMTDGTKVGTVTHYPAFKGRYQPPPPTSDVNFSADRPTITTRVESFGLVATPQSAATFTSTPHYWYCLQYLARAASGMGLPVATTPTGAPVANAAAAAVAYKQSFVKGASEQVGFSNLGEITFVSKATAPMWTAQLMVRWLTATNVNWVRFDVSLDPADPKYPQLTTTPPRTKQPPAP